MAINEATDVPEAARRALQVLLDLVLCDAGSVLYGDPNANDLTFIAAAGPSATKLAGLKVPIERSVAGFCHRTGWGLVVKEAYEDPKFMRDVDEFTGYQTRSILAAPIRTTEGAIYGCVELLNPQSDFQEWMLDAAQNIATILAGYIHSQLMGDD